MSRLLLRGTRARAIRMIVIPAGAAILISIILLFAKGFTAGYSALLGGLVWALPNAMVAYKLFANVSPRAAKQIAVNFYMAEAFKLLLTAILLLVIIKWVPISLGSFLAAYIIAMLTFWLTPLLIK